MHQKRCHVIYLKDSSLRSKQRFLSWITYLSFKGIFKLVRLTQAISSSRESLPVLTKLMILVVHCHFHNSYSLLYSLPSSLNSSSTTFTFFLTFHLLLSSSRWSGVCFRLLASLLGKLSEKENRELKSYFRKLTWVHRWEGKPCASRPLLKASAHPPRELDSPWTKESKSRFNKRTTKEECDKKNSHVVVVTLEPVLSLLSEKFYSQDLFFFF